MITTVHLIRHGETDWNLAGRWQGHADVPLNELGYRQARLVAGRLARDGVMFDAIYSSDLARAFQTAWEIGAAVKVPVQLLPNLREIDLGTWSGLTYDEIRATHPTEIALLEQGQDLPRGGAETLSALRKRVVEAVDALANLHRGGTLGVVSHGGCIRMLLAHAENYQGDGFRRFPHIGNTSVSIIQIAPSGWQTILVNDLSHIEAEHDPDLISTPPDDAERPAL
ncbi:MAG: histidine phosphatase family protein [Oscillochloridaceae bacterium umkhey_bin13]